MSEQELREKIKKAIKNGFQKADCRKPYTNEPYPYFDSQINSIADALIKAEIGDVSEYKHRAEVAERALRKIVEADRAGCLDEKKAVDGMFYFYLQQAEKELQEERQDD